MIVGKSELLVCFDVDDTLVMWTESYGLYNKAMKGTKRFKDPYDGEILYLKPNQSHIKLLKNYRAKNYTIIVWSAQGAKWAETVIKTLELEEYVDFIFPKPNKYVDDMPVDHWMGDRVYIKEKE